MISLFLSAALSFRIAKKQIPQTEIPMLNESDVYKFAKSQKNAVIFYIDTRQVIKPLTKIIEENKSNISFAWAAPSHAASEYCVSFPCVSAFVDGVHKRSLTSDLTYISFDFWLKHTITPPNMEIVHPEELRRLLNLPGSIVFSVGSRERPAIVPQTQTVFYSPKTTFLRLGINVRAGLYVYRHADREFSQFTVWSPSLLQSSLIDIGSDSIRSKKFLVGSFIESNDDASEQRKILSLVNQVIHSNPKDFNFAVFPGEIASQMSYITQFSQICGPLLVVLNSSDLTGERWSFTSKEVFEDRKFLTDTLEAIANGSLKPKKLSLPSQKQFINGIANPVVVDDFKQKILDYNGSSIILITSSCVKVAEEFEALLEAGAKAYMDYGVKFFRFDQGQQDTIEGIPLFTQYPQIIGFGEGTPKKPFSLYQSDLSLNGFLSFVSELSGGSIKLSDKEIMDFRSDLISSTEALKGGKQRSEEL